MRKEDEDKLDLLHFIESVTQIKILHITQWDSQGVVCSPEYYFLWGELSSCHSCALKSDELSMILNKRTG